MSEPGHRTRSQQDATTSGADRLIDAAERTRSNALLAHSDYIVPVAMHEIARQIPDRVAIESGARRITFAELDSSANRLAHALLDRGLDRDTPVLILCDHGVDPPVAICGVLHAGLIAAPVDVKEPLDRLQRVLRASGAEWVLTDGAHAGLARSLTDKVVVLGELEPNVDTTPDVEVHAEHPGLILFTSGSTGTPKGVWLRHRSIVPRAMRVRMRPLEADERLAVTASWGFTAAQTELFRALFNGLPACVYDLRGRGALGLPEWIRATGITELNLQPNVLRAFAEHTAPGTLDCLREVSFGAETLYASDVRLTWPLVGPDTMLRNSLGSTEVGGLANWVVPRDVELPDGPVPVGHPRTNVELRLVDEDGEEVPEGEPGRIVAIRSGHIAGGYWRDPELTAQCFFREPDGRQGFRTSDRARWREDGLLEHLGRLDSRVKVRGAMVATSEVEIALMSLDGVADAAVIAVPDERTGSRLVAYVAPDGSTPLSAWRLRRDVATRVPTTMVPSTFVALEVLPRTVRRKLDRAALPPPPAFAPPPYRAPTGLRAELAALFCGVLGIERIGLDDDFFELGGDSLGAIELLEWIAEEFGIDLPATTLLEAPTVDTLYDRLAHRRAPNSSPVVPLRTGSGRTRFFCVTGAGAPALSLRALADSMDGYDVYAIQARGLEERALPDRSVEAIARRNIRAIQEIQPSGPYALGGDSFGGLVAFEMACALRAAGHAVDLLVLLDSPTPPGSKLATRVRARVDAVRDGAPSGGVSRMAVIGARSTRFGVRSAYEHAERRLVISTAGWMPRRGYAQYDVFYRLQAAAMRKYSPASTFEGPTLLIRAGGPDDRGWSAFATGPLTVVELHCEHRDIIRRPTVERVGRIVADALP